MVAAHGKKRSYLHRFRIIGSPECPRVEGNQTVDHLLYSCSKVTMKEKKLIAYSSKEDNWPINKSFLVNKYLRQLKNKRPT